MAPPVLTPREHSRARLEGKRARQKVKPKELGPKHIYALSHRSDETIYPWRAEDNVDRISNYSDWDPNAHLRCTLEALLRAVAGDFFGVPYHTISRALKDAYLLQHPSWWEDNAASFLADPIGWKQEQILAGRARRRAA